MAEKLAKNCFQLSPGGDRRGALKCPVLGEVAEWSNAPDLKSGDLQGSVGSNPTLSVPKQLLSVRSCLAAEALSKSAFWGLLDVLAIGLLNHLTARANPRLYSLAICVLYKGFTD